MPGLGTSGVGLTPFGADTPVVSAAPPTTAWGARYINPQTRKFEVDPVTGQFRQMPRVRQRVLLAILQQQGSSTVRPKEGLKRPRKMGDGFEQVQAQLVREALRQMTDVEGVLRIDEIIVTRRDNQGAHTDIVFTDLTTGLEDRVSI